MFSSTVRPNYSVTNQEQLTLTRQTNKPSWKNMATVLHITLLSTRLDRRRNARSVVCLITVCAFPSSILSTFSMTHAHKLRCWNTAHWPPVKCGCPDLWMFNHMVGVRVRFMITVKVLVRITVIVKCIHMLPGHNA